MPPQVQACALPCPKDQYGRTLPRWPELLLASVQDVVHPASAPRLLPQAEKE